MSDISGISFGQMFPSAGVAPNPNFAAPSTAQGANYYNQIAYNSMTPIEGEYLKSPSYWAQQVANSYANIGPLQTPGYYNNAAIDAGNSGLGYSGMQHGGFGQSWNSNSGGGLYNPTPLSINNDAWRTSPQGPDWGPGTGFSLNGGGLFSGNANNFPMPQPSSTGPSMDWNNFQSGLDWSNMFGGRGGSEFKPDPYPNMSMPGGLGSPMTVPSSGANAPAAPATPSTTASAPFSMPSESSQGVGGANYQGPGSGLDWSTLWSGNKTAAAPQQLQEKSQDRPVSDTSPRVSDPFTTVFDPKAVRDFGLSGGGQAYEYVQQPGEVAGRAPVMAADEYNPNASASDLAEQAKARLAGLIGSPETAKVVEEAEKKGGSAIPYHRSSQDVEPTTDRLGRPLRPEENPPRPPADIQPKELGFLPGKGEWNLKNVKPEFAKSLREFVREYHASQGDYDVAVRSGQEARSRGGEHPKGNAIDINLIDRRNGERLIDYQTRDPVVFKAYQDFANQYHTFLEKNYPQLAAQHRWGGYFGGDVNKYGAMDLMHHDIKGGQLPGGTFKGGLTQAQADRWELPTGGGTQTPYPKFNFDWSNAPIPDVGPMPLTYKSGGYGGVPNSVYQIDPTTGRHVNVPFLSQDAPGELSSRDFVPAAPAGGQPPRPPGDIPIAGAAPPRASGQAGAAGTVGTDTPAPLWTQGETPRLNADMYVKTTGEVVPREEGGLGGLQRFSALPGSENIVDRRADPGPTRDQLAALLSKPFGYELEPEAGSTPLDMTAVLRSLQNPAEPTPLAAPGFFGADQTRDLTLADRNIPPGELSDKWNEYVYEAVDRPTMVRDESLGPDPNPFSKHNFRQSENVDDRRFDPRLTAEEKAAIYHARPREGTFTETPEEIRATPTGGEIGQWLGTDIIGNLEANAAARRMAGIAEDTTPEGAIPEPSRAQLAQLVGSPETDPFGTGYNEIDAMADAAPTRDDLAAQVAAPGRKTMTFGGGFSATPEPSRRAAPAGVGPEMEPPTPEFMQTVGQTESGFNPNKHNPGSQYKGMYQLNEEEFRQYGGKGSIYDQDQNAMAAMRKMTAEGQTAQNILGRALTPVEQYMVHQQGLYGTLSHLQHPDQPAWKSFQQVSHWNDEKAKTAIWDNLTKDMKAQFGKVENITSRDFIDMWTTKMLQKQVESGQPGGSILP